MTPLTPRQKTLIVNNIIAACGDISKLNRTGYNFLYLASGFIAHYNLEGFRSHYRRYDLGTDILLNISPNMWRNFRPGEKDYEYYSAKADVYRMLCDKLQYPVGA